MLCVKLKHLNVFHFPSTSLSFLWVFFSANFPLNSHKFSLFLSDFLFHCWVSARFAKNLSLSQHLSSPRWEMQILPRRRGGRWGNRERAEQGKKSLISVFENQQKLFIASRVALVFSQDIMEVEYLMKTLRRRSTRRRKNIFCVHPHKTSKKMRREKKEKKNTLRWIFLISCFSFFFSLACLSVFCWKTPAVWERDGKKCVYVESFFFSFSASLGKNDFQG